MGCQRCGLQYDAPVPHCLKCAKELNDQGLCCSCGLNPREPAKQKGRQPLKRCKECNTKRLLSWACREEYAGRKYRDHGARENTWETKHGG